MLKIESQPTIQLRPSSWIFFPFLSKIYRGRHLYLEELQRLPVVIRRFATDHYQNRVAKTLDNILLGELLPWMIAEWFGCKDESVVDKVCSNWMLLYFSIMLLDDALDAPQPKSFDRERAFVVSSLLQQRGLCGLLAMAKRQDHIRETIDHSYEEVALAGASELRGTNERLGNFSEEEIKSSGRKLSFARICVDAIADQIQAPVERVHDLHRILDNLLSALQLLDDLADWEEDSCPRRATMPLALLEQRRAVHGGGGHSSADVLIDLITTRALEDTLQKALELVAKCRNIKEQNFQFGSDWWLRYLNNLNSIGCDVMGELRNARLALTAETQRGYIALSEEKRRTATNKVLGKVRKQLHIVAQSS